MLEKARYFESYENIEDPDDGGDGLHHPERIPTLKIYYSTATGLEEIKGEASRSSLKLYPNPSVDGMIHIDSDGSGPMLVEIFNITGHLVSSIESSSSQMSLNLEYLNSGMYLVKISQAGSSQVEKIILK